MTNIRFDFSSISFEQAKNVISKEDCEQLLGRVSTQSFSINFKKLIFLILGLFMPVFMLISYMVGHEDMPESVLSRTIAVGVALIFIIVLLYSYYKGISRFIFLSYKHFSYTSLKVTYFSYLCGTIGRDDGMTYWQTLLILGIMIPTFLILYRLVERNMIYSVLNYKFEAQLKTRKVFNILIRTSGILIVLGIVILWFYRLNRWWLEGNVVNSTGITFFDVILMIVVGIPFILALTLIPTYLAFKPELYVKANLIETHSEEFRKEYGYTREEWVNYRT